MNTSSDRMIGGLFHVIQYLNSDWWRVSTRFRRFDTYFDPSKSVETFRLSAVLVSTFDISHFYFRQATISQSMNKKEIIDSLISDLAVV